MNRSSVTFEQSNQPLYSVKMRASRYKEHQEEHISGAERIVEQHKLEQTCQQLIQRSLCHAKGDPDQVQIKIEKVDPSDTIQVEALPVSSYQASSILESYQQLQALLEKIGIPKSKPILDLLKQTQNMRGAILWDVEQHKRLEPDPNRGIRATYMDAVGDQVDRSDKQHFKEALILASKVAHCPHIIGELCISDDPDYVTGYFACKSLGYHRISPLKKKGSSQGGRIFLFRGKDDQIPSCIDYLEQQKVLVSL